MNIANPPVIAHSYSPVSLIAHIWIYSMNNDQSYDICYEYLYFNHK